MWDLADALATVCAKVVRRRAEGDEAPVEVAPETLAGMLGPPSPRKAEVAARTGRTGVVLGLSLGTMVGGDILFVEVSRMPGTGALTLTGGLGEVMQESARVALSWVRANAARYGIDPGFHRGADIHVHVQSGALRKDGASAGVAMVAAMVSALTGRVVRGDLAMTGEITLAGQDPARRRHQGEGTGRAPLRAGPRHPPVAEPEACRRGARRRPPVCSHHRVRDADPRAAGLVLAARGCGGRGGGGHAGRTGVLRISGPAARDTEVSAGRGRPARRAPDRALLAARRPSPDGWWLGTNDDGAGVPRGQNPSPAATRRHEPNFVRRLFPLQSGTRRPGAAPRIL